LSSEPQCSDKQLVERILNGEQQAFALLVTRFHRRIYAIAYRMVGNAAEAEDLSQEIFLRVYQNLSRYDQSMPFAPWICRIACNQTLNHLKRRSLALVPISVTVDGEEQQRPIADTRQDPEQALLTRTREQQLQRAILSLPENYRLAFTLKYVEDLTAEEIGEIMQIPRNTIKTWLVRARETLRSKLENEL
jgi:RNA polymerase sigma-70 factor, ECF subfamily